MQLTQQRVSKPCDCKHTAIITLSIIGLMVYEGIVGEYNMIVCILAGNGINFSIAVGSIKLHMPDVK